MELLRTLRYAAAIVCSWTPETSLLVPASTDDSTKSAKGLFSTCVRLRDMMKLSSRDICSSSVVVLEYNTEHSSHGNEELKPTPAMQVSCSPGIQKHVLLKVHAVCLNWLMSYVPAGTLLPRIPTRAMWGPHPPTHKSATGNRQDIDRT